MKSLTGKKKSLPPSRICERWSRPRMKAVALVTLRFETHWDVNKDVARLEV